MKSAKRKQNIIIRRMLSSAVVLIKKCRRPLTAALIMLLIVSLTSGISVPVSRAFSDDNSAACYDSVSLTVHPESGNPGDKIELSGIMPDDARAKAVDVTGEYSDSPSQADILPGIPWARVIAAYDISITSGGDEYQPDSLNPVNVEITNPDIPGGGKLQLIHIKDDGTYETVSEFTADEGRLSFAAEGFSVYAIVDIAQPVDNGSVSSLDELTGDSSASGFRLYYGSKTYFTNTVNVSGSNSVLAETASTADSAIWRFKKIGDTGSNYKIYTVIGGAEKYIYTKSGNNIGLGDEASADIIEISAANAANKTFYFKKSGENKWLQHSNGGKGIRYYTDNNNAVNSQIGIDYGPGESSDYLHLDGTSFGLMSYPGGTLGYGFMADEDNNSLSMMSLTVRKQTGTETLYVADNTDITIWSFSYIGGGKYLISTEIDGETKYLNIGSTLSLVDEQQASEITVLSNNSNQLSFSCSGKSVTFSGTEFVSGDTASGNSAQWLHIVRPSTLTQTDYVTYHADKISISDVPDGASVIVYTRVWNSSTNSYDFYAIDHDGTLYPCYERGDDIMWVGNQINTLLWDFTEYTYEDGTPNNYYELYNPYSRKYIAPQIKDGQTLSDSKIGINLPGRVWGDYYSGIIAWDDPYYAYSGLQSDIGNGRIVSGPKSDADTFYFATVRNPVSTLTTVNTIDNSQYGIEMKMIDFSSPDVQNTFLGSSVSNLTAATKGLLSTNLGSDGYPTAAGGSLAGLFTESQTKTVNHLFLESTYNASGYYEFDSCQNYATLVKPDGTVGTDFTVYSELGTMDDSSRSTLKHGQFMPYNNISAGVYCTENNPENLYSALAQYNKPEKGLLPDSDPRKHEKLHKITSPNYYNGMEMTAVLTQTPNGKDAWGNDIIFEFTGDDDFWFYVDGELIIDLGGIHSALQGNCNFSSGIVNVEGTRKTLRQIFRENYVSRNPGATEQEINSYLAGYFEEGSTVFRPYTTHKMTIFYMERGAGASNLHMRFNLSNVTPGNVMLTKTVSGSDDLDFNLVEYPYQIWYKDDETGAEHLLTNANSLINVTYQNSTQRIDYLPVYTPPNSSVSYDSVYLLNPGKSAEVHFPMNTIEYRIVECGINDEVYDSVMINGVAASPDSIPGSGRSSYDSGWHSVVQQPSIVFDNHVDPDSLRTVSIEKTLYDESGNLLSAQQDKSVFNYRLYLSNGTDDNLTAANMVKYYVTDDSAEGHLCSWDADSGRLVPSVYTDYDSLTASEKGTFTFETSMNGAISKIPAGYVVHIPNVAVGTRFMLVERENEIPLGYSFVEYERESGTYHAEDGDTINSGWVRANESPKMYVVNKRGWGIDVRKQWSDASFTKSHAPVYAAVYAGDTLVPGTVRMLSGPDAGTRYFFDSIIAGYTFSDYSVHEVELVNPGTDINGNITYDSISRKLNDGDLTAINAVPSNSDTPALYSYSVEYTAGTPVSTDTPESQLKNVRSDTITNLRTGGVVITLYDMHTREPLADGVFKLEQGGNTIGTFTSDTHGRVTILYDFERNVNYSLTEQVPPTGYAGLPNTAVFSIADDDTVTVSGNEAKWQSGRKSDIAGDKLIAYIDIYNEQFTLRAVKTDANTREPLEGARFALYRSVTGIGGLVKDLTPMPGFESLVTGSDGVIPLVNASLAPGKYYLTETDPPVGYEPLAGDIVFTIKETGEVVINSTGHGDYLSVQGEDIRNYTITVPNIPSDNAALLTVTKTVTGSFGNRAKPFTFTLTVDGAKPSDEYQWTLNGVTQSTALHSGGTFTLAQDDTVTVMLPKGIDITVTEANDGYNTTFALGGEEAENVSTKTFRLTQDTSLEVINRLDTPVPTGVFDGSVSIVPAFLALLSLALFMLIIIRKHRAVIN